MTKDVFELINEFNRDLVGFPQPSSPTRLSPERKEFGLGFLEEELKEYRDADTIEDEVDALIDLIYVAGGRLYEMGTDGMAHFLEVHRCNMAKERGTKSTRPTSQGYDTIKPEGWTGPDHLRVMLEIDPHKPLAIDADFRFVLDPSTKIVDPNPPLMVEWTLVQPPRPKVLIIGHARHGKDTVAEILRDEYGLSFTSSSLFCAERVVRPYMAEKLGRTYGSAQACFDDRHSWRSTWYDAIAAYCSPDKTRLAREIAESFDIYVGLRHKTEFQAVKNACLFDHIIWIDALDRLPAEPTSSMSLEPWMAHWVIDNNGTLEDLQRNVRSLAETMGLRSVSFAKAA